MAVAGTHESDADRMVELLVGINRALWWTKQTKVKSLAFELTFAQGRCLWAVARSGGCTMRELSQNLGVRPSTACELVDRLVLAGLVVREQVPEDRRMVRLRLSLKGRRWIAKHRQERRKHMELFLNRLTVPQRAQVLHTLEELNEVIQQVSEQAYGLTLASRRRK